MRIITKQEVPLVITCDIAKKVSSNVQTCFYLDTGKNAESVKLLSQLMEEIMSSKKYVNCRRTLGRGLVVGFGLERKQLGKREGEKMF